MNSRSEGDKPKIISACDILKALLTREPLHDTQFGAGNYHNAYTWELNELMRTKTACKLDMVVSPFTTNRNLVFTTREDYPSELERANREASEYSLRFRKKTS
jgi:hypothetical protein